MKFRHIVYQLVLVFVAVASGVWFAEFVKKPSVVSVKGLSEKVVAADLGLLTIRIRNENSNITELYRKSSEDRNKVLAFLKKNGIIDSEIVSCDLSVYERNKEARTNSAGVIEREYYLETSDEIKIRTSIISKIQNLKNRIVTELNADGLYANCSYSYKITNFSQIKQEMMKEASEQAIKSAQSFLYPHNMKPGKLVYLRQGEISINSDDINSGDNSWSNESESVNKKLRLVASAEFEIEPIKQSEK